MDYFNFTDSSRHFFSDILRILIEDRRTAYAEPINSSLKLGDIVIARTFILSDKKKETVTKLSYAVRGPYQIIHTTNHGNYFVNKLHRPDSSKLKFIPYNFYPLPPSLKPCDSVDTIDTRYLNQTHVPLINLLKKALHIKLYNEKWFDKLLETSIPPFTYKYDTLELLDESVYPFLSVVDLHDETNTLIPQPLYENVDDDISLIPFPLTLHNSLENTDCLFFIQYTPEDTIKPWWYLI